MSEYRRVTDAAADAAHSADKALVIAYMDGGQVVQAARGRGDDRLDPTRRRAVPLTVLTDGVWVWTGATRYYLAEHDVWPEPDFVAHVVQRGRPAVMDEAALADVSAWLRR